MFLPPSSLALYRPLPVTLAAPVDTPFGQFSFYNGIHEGFQLGGGAEELVDTLSGPSAFFVPAKRTTSRMRVVATLLDGNDSAATSALARMFAKNKAASLWAHMLYFVGNPLAAQEPNFFSNAEIPLKGVEQAYWNMNRVWSDDVPEAVAMLRSALLTFLQPFKVEALFELHHAYARSPQAYYAEVCDGRSRTLVRRLHIADVRQSVGEASSFSLALQKALNVPAALLRYQGPLMEETARAMIEGIQGLRPSDLRANHSRP